jgi:hypothetical protein
MLELPSAAPFILTPVVPPCPALPRLGDFRMHGASIVRLARKVSGPAFGIDDLLECGSLPLDQLITRIRSEPDHPYAPLLGNEDHASAIIVEEHVEKSPPLEILAWLSGLLTDHSQIYVPTVAPTLALSLDKKHGHLLATIACPPAPSASMRLPTLHMPLATDQSVLKMIAEQLHVELTCSISPPEVSGLLTDDRWMLATLAHLYRYVSRKGCSRWPDYLSFECLHRVDVQFSRAEHVPAPIEWLGQFLDSQSEDFGPLRDYVDGLQRLVFARYAALGETLPPMPSDVLVDLRL